MSKTIRRDAWRSGVTIALLILTGCNRDEYRVVERTQRLIPDASAGPHTEVGYVLAHNGRKIYATCDWSTVNNLDPKASCGLRPLRTYKCELGPDDIQNAAVVHPSELDTRGRV